MGLLNVVYLITYQEKSFCQLYAGGVQYRVARFQSGVYLWVPYFNLWATSTFQPLRESHV